MTIAVDHQRMGGCEGRGRCCEDTVALAVVWRRDEQVSAPKKRIRILPKVKLTPNYL